MNLTTYIFVGLGSNIDAENNVRKAINNLSQQLGNARVSYVYRSSAIGMDGNDFLNAVVGGNTDLTLDETVTLLQESELRQGRVRTANKFSDRTLDLDLLLYGNLTNDKLPHPEITDQAYVLQPLFDIAPELIHPIRKQSIATLRHRLLQSAPEKFNALRKVDLSL